MSRRREIRKMKQGLRRMYAAPIEQNKIVKARRYGFIAGCILWTIVLSITAGIYYGVRLAIHG